MHRILFMCLDAAIAAVILVPVFLWLNHCLFHNPRRAGQYILLAIYFSAMFAVVGLPDICYIRFAPNMNLRPFAYMFSDYMNSLLNVVLFVPLGCFLPLLWKYFGHLRRTVFFGLSLSLLIEILQLFTLRATDVNDLMTNTFGTFLGFLLAKLILRLFPGIRPSWRTRDVWVVCAVSFGVMFFLQPFLANTVMRCLRT